MDKVNNVFLNKIFQRIKDGEYDKYLTIPFMTKELLFSTIKTKFNKKIASNGTPILNDVEIKECIETSKETAATTFIIFLKEGLLVKTASGYELSDKGQIAIRNYNKI